VQSLVAEHDPDAAQKVEHRSVADWSRLAR
jgi:hypothetical protein